MVGGVRIPVQHTPRGSFWDLLRVVFRQRQGGFRPVLTPKHAHITALVGAKNLSRSEKMYRPFQWVSVDAGLSQTSRNGGSSADVPIVTGKRAV